MKPADTLQSQDSPDTLPGILWFYGPEYKYCSFMFSSEPPKGDQFPDKAAKFAMDVPPSIHEADLRKYKRDHRRILRQYPETGAILDGAEELTLEAVIGELEAATGLKCYRLRPMKNGTEVRVPAASVSPGPRPAPLEMDF